MKSALIFLISNPWKLGLSDKYKESIEAQYRARNTGQVSYSPSLKSFVSHEPLSLWLQERLSTGPWCEIGSGDRSLFEMGDDLITGLTQKNDLWAFDLSEAAIETAQGGGVYYQQHDLTSGIPHGPYSFILDGHFLHCLPSFPMAYQVLGHILHALPPSGLFAGEVMIAHKNLSFDHDLYYDPHSSVLSFEGRPTRLIMEAREWEDLFKNAGFEIKYFVCQSSIKMIPSIGRQVPMSGDPECLRFVVGRAE